MPENNFIYNDRYILTSPQDVQHDNSLSGNGTLTSPLGVNTTFTTANQSDMSISAAVTGMGIELFGVKQGDWATLRVNFDPMAKYTLTTDCIPFKIQNSAWFPAYTVIDTSIVCNSTAYNNNEAWLNTDGRFQIHRQNGGLPNSNLRIFNFTYRLLNP